MIRISISSRMGNQLFQQAFAYAAAKRLKTWYLIDTSQAKQGNIVPRYFALSKRYYFYQVIWSKFSSVITIGNGSRTAEIVQVGTDRPDEVVANLKNDANYAGYFQSLSYFKEYQAEIRELFEVRRHHRDRFKQLYSEKTTGKKLIAVHVRRTDYLTFGKHILGGENMCLPESYYIACLNKCYKPLQHELYFISDDLGYAKSTYLKIFPRAKFELNSDIIDLQILMHASILILSNSSFAWWGAYLNKIPDKVVYAPRYWLGHKIEKEYPEQIIPDSWIQMNVHTDEKLAQKKK